MGRETACDILIVGGGTGGCAAALSATAMGYRVIMTEPTAWIGGQLTSQAVPPDENIWIQRFGCTRTYREFRERVRQYYRENYRLTDEARQNPALNPGGGYVSALCFEPRVGVAALEGMLIWPRVCGLLEIRHFCELVAVQMEGDRLSSVTIRHIHRGENEEISARYVIDATELGDLLPLSGTEYVTGAESQAETGEPHAITGPAEPDNVQGITWCFPLAWDRRPGANHVGEAPEQYAFWRDYAPELTPAWGGKLLTWWLLNEKTGEHMERALFLRPDAPKEWFRGLWGYRKIRGAEHYDPANAPDEVTLVNWPQNDYFVKNPIDRPAPEVAVIWHEAKQLSLSLYHWIQTEAPRHDGGAGYPEVYIPEGVMGTEDGLAMAPYIRESRRIRAEFTILEQHVSKELNDGLVAPGFHDSVGIGAYMIDLHPSTNGRHSVSVPSVPFQIPLGALIPVRVQNLLPACKNIGTTHITNGCYRLHPIEWNIGEVAGYLAAYCLSKNIRPATVRANEASLADFQSLLNREGIELAWPESEIQ